MDLCLNRARSPRVGVAVDPGGHVVDGSRMATAHGNEAISPQYRAAKTSWPTTARSYPAAVRMKSGSANKYRVSGTYIRPGCDAWASPRIAHIAPFLPRKTPPYGNGDGNTATAGLPVAATKLNGAEVMSVRAGADGRELSKGVIDLEPFVAIEEAAEFLGVKVSWIYEQVRLNRMPSHKVGHFRRFKLSELDEWARGAQREGDASRN